MAVFYDQLTRRNWPLCRDTSCILPAEHTPHCECERVAPGWVNPWKIPRPREEEAAVRAELEREERKG